MRDPYTILGVPQGADEKTVRKAYKKLAVAHHPDRNPDPDAAERFKEVAAAYSVLTNERERQRYVRLRRREHAEQEQHRRQQAAEARRRAAAERSKAAAAAEEVFWSYARQVRERRTAQESAGSRPSASTTAKQLTSGKEWGHWVGVVAAIVLMATYVWRSIHGLPLQPWLSGGSFATHPLHSPIWITMSLSLLMIIKPKWFLIPLIIDGPRDVRLAGWAMFLLFPFIAAGGPFWPYLLWR